MDISYLVTPFLTWLVVGPIKFLITSARQRRWAFNLVGNIEDALAKGERLIAEAK